MKGISKQQENSLTGAGTAGTAGTADYNPSDSDLGKVYLPLPEAWGVNMINSRISDVSIYYDDAWITVKPSEVIQLIFNRKEERDKFISHHSQVLNVEFICE